MVLKSYSEVRRHLRRALDFTGTFLNLELTLSNRPAMPRQRTKTDSASGRPLPAIHGTPAFYCSILNIKYPKASNITKGARYSRGTLRSARAHATTYDAIHTT